MLKRIAKIAGIVLLILVAAGAFIYFRYLKPRPLPVSAEARAAVSLMPLPAQLKINDGKILLQESMGVDIEGPADSIVLKATERFRKKFQTLTGISILQTGSQLKLKFREPAATIQPEAPDESYSLTIDDNEITLQANTGYGVLRGLESLLQLVKKDEDGKYYWPALELTDAPRYSWRGLMIDVSRHWIPKDAILRNIEAMAAVKMNVLHLHLSDYQGFRVESKVFPRLHESGSGGNYYTHEDIREMVAFARERGVRIVPEFDMPGHTTSLLVGYPELASAPGPYKLETNFGVLLPVLDPTREEVYTFIDRFVGEMAALFPDPFFHIGGDEVNFKHWEENTSIQAFMKEHNLATTKALHAYFNQRVEPILKKHNKRMIGWDEILDPNLSKSIVVQCWRTHKSLYEAVQKGSHAILSAGYYLDHKLPAGKHYGIDPEVMQGAVTITPDSVHWKQYDLTLYVSDSPMNLKLILYGQDANLRGLFYLMDNATGFENATLTGNDLNFSFASDFGKIDVAGKFNNDSITGDMSLGLLSFPFRGRQTGGENMTGTKPPRVEQMKPLTPEDKSRIIGAEAAMWTEVASALNIDSRIWPRTAAMAEKWWTPRELTTDAADMYRRLESISAYLDKIGTHHLLGQRELIRDLAQGKDETPVGTLVDVLEEVKYYERVNAVTNTLVPLNEVVDAAAPESLSALKFSKMTDEFLNDSLRQKNEAEIRQFLVSWRNNHAAFQQTAAGNPRLQKVMQTSEELSASANFALLAMDALTGKQALTLPDKEAMLKVINAAPPSRAGTLIAVMPAIKKLVNAIPAKELKVNKL